MSLFQEDATRKFLINISQFHDTAACIERTLLRSGEDDDDDHSVGKVAKGQRFSSPPPRVKFKSKLRGNEEEEFF